MHIPVLFQQARDALPSVISEEAWKASPAQSVILSSDNFWCLYNGQNSREKGLLQMWELGFCASHFPSSLNEEQSPVDENKRLCRAKRTKQQKLSLPSCCAAVICSWICKHLSSLAPGSLIPESSSTVQRESLWRVRVRSRTLCRPPPPTKVGCVLGAKQFAHR